MTQRSAATDHPQGRRSGPRGGRPRDPAVDESILVATRRRLVTDGYIGMALGDIAADAGVTRPTLYRRWPGKLELVIDALDYGLRAQLAATPPFPLDDMTPEEAFTEAIRRVDPCYYNPDAIILQGGFISEAERVPELLAHVVTRAVEPRVSQVEDVLRRLIDRGAVRADTDTRTVATMVFGAFFGAFLRGDDTATRARLPEQLAAALWPALTTQP
ncbi:putative TetR family transcriptional regulator [Nocardia brasiliensis NBRC 14402]|uniref:TetR/AcrR family transcriptional regulator n=1 Tax=Nocardia brasiliensis TaxID=37326 RepID=UPI000319938E|nr:TetR/AcrR family transcriptional regulator [Nocardia brasiliensis]ASF06988.1 TetR/AcrR family transcriptional regulator [Nocardia brasiliensis]GAJ84388.1 putative TetR family transcriptional regulator [Nocardia brasiliensis NBRC 14402]SUB47774.1 Bacterial regulatory proteins, tetR family [Nocardia brasiliensis]